MEDPRSPCPRDPNPPAPPPDPERLLRKSTAWGRRKLAPATCHCPVLVLSLPFLSSSCRADDGGPALFAPPAPPPLLLLSATRSPTTAQVRLLAANFCLGKQAGAVGVCRSSGEPESRLLAFLTVGLRHLFFILIYCQDCWLFLLLASFITIHSFFLSSLNIQVLIPNGVLNLFPLTRRNFRHFSIQSWFDHGGCRVSLWKYWSL